MVDERIGTPGEPETVAPELPAKVVLDFKTEASLWEMMATGRKRWDARLNDLDDERIYALMMRRVDGLRFVNKATGQIIAFADVGRQLPDWAPGWVVMQLGDRLHELEIHTALRCDYCKAIPDAPGIPCSDHRVPCGRELELHGEFAGWCPWPAGHRHFLHDGHA